MSADHIPNLFEIGSYAAASYYNPDDLYQNQIVPQEVAEGIRHAQSIPNDDDLIIERLQHVYALNHLNQLDFKSRQYLLHDAIRQAAIDGNIFAARKIISSHPYLCHYVDNIYPFNFQNHYTNYNGQLTALHEACRRGNLEFAKLLLSHGANIRCSIRGITPLSLAQQSDSPELVAYLQQQLALPDQRPLTIRVQLARYRFQNSPDRERIIAVAIMSVVTLMLILLIVYKNLL
jgi:hypothetical protein